jgi:tRNA(fMet)-specific endonuclease VapC
LSRAPEDHYLLDTGILVSWVRGDAIAKWVETQYALTKTPLRNVVSIVTVGEVRAFAKGGRKHRPWGAAKLRVLDDFLSGLVRFDISDDAVLAAYAELDHYSSTLKSPRNMGKNDLWIAATARATGLRLLTLDCDFDHLDGELIRRDYIDSGAFLRGAGRDMPKSYPSGTHKAP